MTDLNKEELAALYDKLLQIYSYQYDRTIELSVKLAQTRKELETVTTKMAKLEKIAEAVKEFRVFYSESGHTGGVYRIDKALTELED